MILILKIWHMGNGHWVSVAVNGFTVWLFTIRGIFVRYRYILYLFFFLDEINR